MRFNQPYAGHYFKGLLYSYDSDTEELIEPPKTVRFRPHDLSNRDIGTGIKTEEIGNHTYQIGTHSMVIQIVDKVLVEVGDKFKDLTDGQMYTIKKIEKGYDSISALTNLLFKGLDNRPKILFLGNINE